MEIFVTLLDSLFLPQGLALNTSLARHSKAYSLWILCVDDESYNSLKKLALANVTPLKLSDLEDETLLALRANRSRAEYCWTLTPLSIAFVFNALPDAARVTYVDADTWLLQNPKYIFDQFELSGKNVMITEHGYAPSYDQSKFSGKYCVQFMVFTRKGEVVRKWWEDRCIEWCFARHEDGKFGDQKYLDDWTSRFSEHVYVFPNNSAFQAPWNALRFPYSEAFLWHFHGCRLTVKDDRVRSIWTGSYPIPAPAMEHVYKRYGVDLKSAVADLVGIGVHVRSQGRPSFFIRVGLVLRQILRIFNRVLAGKTLRV